MVALARRRPPRRPWITLTSDIGWAYAAQMKAVLASSIGLDRVVDLAHDLRPHEIREAAFVLCAMARGFPAGTIHVAVVDPGVGGARAALAVECRDGSRLVGPDNGLLVPLAEALGAPRAYRLDPGRVGAAGRVGATFDGRDLFAPAAARLASGARARELGAAQPMRTLARWRGRSSAQGAEGIVAHVDRFGNLITDLPSEWVPPGTSHLLVRVNGRSARLPWVRSYSDLRVGASGLLPSSFGTIELARREARADRRFPARPGDPVALGRSARTDRSRARTNRNERAA